MGLVTESKQNKGVVNFRNFFEDLGSFQVRASLLNMPFCTSPIIIANTTVDHDYHKTIRKIFGTHILILKRILL